MADKDLRQMFKDSVVRISKSKKKLSENSVFNRLKGSPADDHYTICPFRDTPKEDCPLCLLDELGI